MVITLLKKGNLQQCQNYRTIILISHPSKVMLKIILNRLKPQSEKIIVEEKASFRAGRNTTERILNLSILCKKYLQHQQDLYHVFTEFKKALDRVWHAALWTTMNKYNISANLLPDIKHLCDKYLQHQQDLYHVFIDFKKAFDRVWHAALCATMKYNISANPIRVIKNHFDKATSAVHFNSNIGDWFQTTVGV